MGAIASQITSLTIVYSIVYSDADQRKHQSSASLAFVRGIHRGPVNSPHKWPVTRKMFPFHDVIMIFIGIHDWWHKVKLKLDQLSGRHSHLEYWYHQPTCLTHWGRDKMDTTSQTTFSRAFSLNENVWISIKISLKFVPKGPINNIPALVQIMAWCRPGDKPLSWPTMVNLPTHKCVSQPQWVKSLAPERCGSKFKVLLSNSLYKMVA